MNIDKLATELITKYGKDKGFIERGLLACRNAGVSETYFIERYLEGNKEIGNASSTQQFTQFNADVDYQSRLIQRLIRE